MLNRVDNSVQECAGTRRAPRCHFVLPAHDPLEQIAGRPCRAAPALKRLTFRPAFELEEVRAGAELNRLITVQPRLSIFETVPSALIAHHGATACRRGGAFLPGNAQEGSKHQLSIKLVCLVHERLGVALDERIFLESSLDLVRETIGPPGWMWRLTVPSG